ncbi:helix-turn-helix transcriptional regulator [Palleronia abyssalis]|uniref:Transcriptional activator protein AnoR n=1 Tax=Palleronia abyssalis TaxID=1501240 RepID=A0A2R8BZA0_9RHOB|nr:autoinducer binding domain-containing protein [Palleronia abyssalis]SPJ25501.1 Transcriptional activator protein AnoR [Palleronia abyssalis]
MACLEYSTGKLREFGISGYSLLLHVRGLFCTHSARTYPEAWIKRYDENNYALRDPVLGWCFAHDDVLRWSDPALPDPYGIMPEAARFGLRYGVSISAGPATCRSIVSVARPDRELTEEECVCVREIALCLHEELQPDRTLTWKQSEALRCAADGLRAKQAAYSLGISEAGYKARLTSIRACLKVQTTAEAIQIAKAENLI